MLTSSPFTDKHAFYRERNVQLEEIDILAPCDSSTQYDVVIVKLTDIMVKKGNEKDDRALAEWEVCYCN